MAYKKRCLAALASVALASMAFANTAGATVLHVPGDFPTIQGCIDAAIPGDECVVDPGTYNELINFHGKAITLRSSDGPEVTIIDAGPVPDPGTGKPVVRCDTGEGPDTVLNGFTLTGGTGSAGDACGFASSSRCGGGMYNVSASPTVTNCTFSGNSVAHRGGGVYNNFGSNPTLTACTFSGNSTGDSGGALYNKNSNPIVTDCNFIGNSTGVGAGMYNSGSSPTVSNCVFSENTAQLFGGGMFNGGSSHPTLSNCIFNENTAQMSGGGMENIGSNPAVTNCSFSGNSAIRGGGMFNSFSSTPTVVNSTFTANSASSKGGGMANLASNPTLINCTFSGNSAAFTGGGMYNANGSNPTVADCSFSGNSADNGGGMYNWTSSPTVTNSIFDGNLTGGGMYNQISANPMVTNCIFTGNSAAGAVGGGMTNLIDCNPTVADCIFKGNSATTSGGGMFNWDGSSPTVSDCTFSGNTAEQFGGGMFNLLNSGPTVTNCTFSGNTAGNGSGGGMCNEASSDPTVTNCTFTGNIASSGGGMFSGTAFGLPPAPVLSNCILSGNAPDQIVDDFGAVTTVSYSNVQGGLPVGTVDGGGNIDAEPMFVRNPSDGGDGWDDDPGTPDVDEGANDDYGDLRLLFGSPCIDTGDNAALPADVGDLDDDGDMLEAIPFDLDGHARVLCSVVDMGAYESGIGDDDCDGIVGLGDFGAYFDCLTGPAGGLLSGCEPFDFDGDGDVDLIDLAGFQSVFTGQP